MKHRWLYTLGMVLGMVAFSTAEATTSTGPVYNLPSWDQQLTCKTKSNCPRFIVLSNWGDAAVLDKETGLVWEQSPSESTSSWYDAQGHCNTLTTGNRLGWRLPTVEELASLMDPTVNPALPTGAPFRNILTTNHFYWTATTQSSDSTVAWDVSFSASKVSTDYKIDTILLAWCVRGGQGVDPQ